MSLLKSRICRLEKRVTLLEGQEVTVSADVTKKTARLVVYEATINEDGAIGQERINTQDLVVTGTQTIGSGNNDAGNDYQITFSALSPSATFGVTITGDVGTGGSNNAIVAQDFDISGNILTYSLYSGDDGQGVDDARDRIHILRMYDNCEFVADITFSGTEEPEPQIEDFGDITINEALRTVAGWNNQPISGTTAFADDVQLSFTVQASVANTATMIGLNTDPNTDANWASIDYAAYILHVGGQPQLRVYESGTLQFGTTNLNDGDEVTVTRTGTVIDYAVNGGSVFTSPTASVGDLYADSSAFGNATYSGDLNLTGVIMQ